MIWLPVAYVMGMIVSLYPLSQWVLRHGLDVDRRDEESLDRVFSIALGLLLALLWPLIVFGAVGYRLSRRLWDSESSEKEHSDAS